MTKYFIAITSTQGYFSTTIIAGTEDEAIEKAVEKFASYTKKIKDIFVKEI